MGINIIVYYIVAHTNISTPVKYVTQIVHLNKNGARGSEQLK